ncbi:MAG: inorganic pyrophosphatase [Planctomycetota bacterium]|nr:inorganic pyrophosphatase [Planctomycetota bacterium]
MQASFWTHLEALVASSEIVLDRPKGSSHPRYPSIVYPLDYGYLKGTSGGDGNEMDVWRGSLPEGRLDAVVCTVDVLKRDAEVKLLIGCSPTDKHTVLEFHSAEHGSAMLVERGTTEPIIGLP